MELNIYGNHVREIEKSSSKKEYLCILFMDISKVFDTVNHSLLLASCMDTVSL